MSIGFDAKSTQWMTPSQLGLSKSDEPGLSVCRRPDDRGALGFVETAVDHFERRRRLCRADGAAAQP